MKLRLAFRVRKTRDYFRLTTIIASSSQEKKNKSLLRGLGGYGGILGKKVSLGRFFMGRVLMMMIIVSYADMKPI